MQSSDKGLSQLPKLGKKSNEEIEQTESKDDWENEDNENYNREDCESI